MNILIVNHEYPPVGGGGANACYYISKGLVAKGYRVTVLTANYKNLNKFDNIDGVEIVRVPALRRSKDYSTYTEMLSFLTSALPRAIKLHKKDKYDIVQVFFGIPSGPIGWVLKKLYKVPYVIRMGGGDVPGFQDRFAVMYKVLAPFIKRLWKDADKLVVNSEGLKEMALNFMPEADVEIICNGVDTDCFKPKEDRQETDFVNILFVSRLIERKGLQYVIPVLPDVIKESQKHVKLTVVGDGPYRRTLEELTQEYKIQDIVSFKGYKEHDQLLKYYQNADMFILPSEKEGMPNVVLEAMACGLPIIMSDCQGSKELIHDNGVIIKDKSNSLSHNIIALVNLREKKVYMQNRSRDIITSKYTWSIITNQYSSMYSNILCPLNN